MSEPQRIRPQGSGWVLNAVYPEFTAYQNGNICALSSSCLIEDEHLPAHWEWLISFSDMGERRLNNQQIKRCLRDFRADDFVEDNHERGIARKFWKAVEEKYRVPCPCKDELVITEGDYQYSVKKQVEHLDHQQVQNRLATIPILLLGKLAHNLSEPDKALNPEAIPK